MSDNYLITGYWGEPHVTAENDRGINAAIFGDGRYVLPVGEKFRAEYIGNNTVRVYDGKLLDNGAAAGIPAGKYIDLLIPEAGQGMNRNDLIIFQYSQDASTLIETGIFKVLSGTETSGTAVDPELAQEDILSDEATFDQMALWRVSVSGANISAPVQMFTVANNFKKSGETIVAATSDDGVSYTAEVDGLESLINGYGITIIPNIDSASTTPTLNVNGLGAVQIRRRASNSTATVVASSGDGWLGEGEPIRVVYNGRYWVADFVRPNANDLYGSVVKSTTVNLASDGWSDNQQTVSAKNVTASNTVFVSPATDSSNYSAYTKNGVRCIAQAAGTITFECEKVPSSSITVNVAVFA